MSLLFASGCENFMSPLYNALLTDFLSLFIMESLRYLVESISPYSVMLSVEASLRFSSKNSLTTDSAWCCCPHEANNSPADIISACLVFMSYFVGMVDRMSIRWFQTISTVGMSRRSSGVCTPRRVGPNEIMSRLGYLSENSPHSRPA